MPKKTEMPGEGAETKQAEWKELVAGLDALGAASVWPDSDLRDVVGYEFSELAFPRERESDEPFPELPRSIEILPIDLLGKYEPRWLRITIYKTRIKQVASSLQVSHVHLERVVRLHEWAHALVHVGQYARTASPSNRSYADPKRRAADVEVSAKKIRTAGTRLFHQIEDVLHEQIAQLLTWHCVQMVASRARTISPQQGEFLVAAFDRLGDVQPREYRIEGLQGIPAEWFRDVFDMLKRSEITPTVFMKVLQGNSADPLR